MSQILATRGLYNSRRFGTMTTKSASSSICQNRHNIYYHSRYHISLTDRMYRWFKGQDEKKNIQAWLGEARRFLEYEDYTMKSFENHCRAIVDSYDKSGYFKRGMRRFTKWFNPESAEQHDSMIDESRTMLNIIETFPEEAMGDPEKYFTSLNKSKLAIETKMHTSDIDSVVSKFTSNRDIHKQLKTRVINGIDLPRTSEEVHGDLAKPRTIMRNYQKNISFGRHNPNMKNDIYEANIINWNEKVWAGPTRRRQGYQKKKTWRSKDWRLYQPKWESKPALLTKEQQEIDHIVLENANKYAHYKRLKKQKDIRMYGPRDDSIWDDVTFRKAKASSSF